MRNVGSWEPGGRNGPATRRIVLAAFVAASIHITGVAIADDGPGYEAYEVGTFLAFTNRWPPSGTIDAVPRLEVAFASGMRRAIEVDTGSTGVAVSADQLTATQGMPCDACLTYTSSGRILSGTWIATPVTIYGANDASVTTMPISVLAVTRVSCTRDARSCQPSDRPRGIAVMGVGFGREHDRQADGTPDRNPFLSVEHRSPQRRGYVLTADGVHIGLTRSNTRGAFHFVALERDALVPGEWRPAPTCITIGSDTRASCGDALFDTGVTSMFLTLPPLAVRKSIGGDGGFLAGTRIRLRFPDASGDAAAVYDIVVGSGHDPAAPDLIHLNTTRPATFVNTGVRFLNNFDVLYDADGGFIAYRARRRSQLGADEAQVNQKAPTSSRTQGDPP